MSVIVITGASSGIGRALALRAARAGYDVVAIGRNRIALDALAERVRGEGGSIAVEAIDVSQPANARTIVALAARTFGGIDVLVNNAGHVAVGPLAAQSDAALQDQFGTHVIGPIALVREALPLLRQAGGHVFMVGSGVARVPVHGLGAYSPSKAATRSATAILRRELKPEGIAVTYVDPGAVDTAFMTRAGMPGAPASMLASPEVVARKILLAVARRPRVLNAVPWQTAFVAIGELFPRLTDALLERNPALVGIQPADEPALAAQPVVALAPTAAEAPPTEAPASGDAPTFADAIEPVRRRMERVKLSEAFVRDLLQPDAVLDPAEIALRWAGMPNKNERAATIEVLEALAEAGFLARDGERYRVVRAAS
ncbi:MAG: short-chain dehydrogenase/reductase [Candidatus Eremiobacteraeota bacterium]|nr:short-chain dehydrogenase/reductase [Candidatus Eremiobacteraeota bacterium]